MRHIFVPPSGIEPLSREPESRILSIRLGGRSAAGTQEAGRMARSAEQYRAAGKVIYFIYLCQTSAMSIFKLNKILIA